MISLYMTGKHKTKSSLKKRFLKRKSGKIVFKAGYTSHRLSRRRDGSVAERSKRCVLTNPILIQILQKSNYISKLNRDVSNKNKKIIKGVN